MSSWIPYGRQTVEEDDIQAVIEVLRSDWLTTGPTVERFENALAERVGARFAVTFNSGTAALHAAYFAAGVGPGDEVVTSPLTFAATANAALYLGARPVFVDVQEDTGNLDPEQVRRVLTARTKVIAPVDFAGHPADLDELKEIAREAGAVLVEDACHALGAMYRGRSVGSIADMTVFSFHPVKHITTGEGGAVVTDNPTYYQRLRLFRNHGITRDATHLTREPEGPWYYEMQVLGYNYRLSDIAAALGFSQLRKLDRFLQRRREIATRYGELLKGLPLQTPVPRSDVVPAWHLYVVRLSEPERRRAVVEGLHRLGIGVQVHYVPVYRHPYYRNISSRAYCPVAERVYAASLSLPIYPLLSDAEVERTVMALRSVL